MNLAKIQIQIRIQDLTLRRHWHDLLEIKRLELVDLHLVWLQINNIKSLRLKIDTRPFISPKIGVNVLDLVLTKVETRSRVFIYVSIKSFILHPGHKIKLRLEGNDQVCIIYPLAKINHMSSSWKLILYVYIGNVYIGKTGLGL